VNREVNNGRGPVDFKLSKGAVDKSLNEIKLASNSQLKRNLQNQVEVYEKANGTRTSVKMIVCYTEADVAKVYAVLKELDLRGEKSIVVIDARADNKPSGSKA
jgi:predicted Rossmann fold nucleotide-binding protein DprA/Smf involved in DNA uptake